MTELQKEIDAKATAPRITPADIEANIVSEHYFTAADGARMSPHGNHPIHNLSAGSLGLLTFCVLVLRNGFTVTGESACASPENFDAEIGRKVARENAIEKIWPLLGFSMNVTREMPKYECHKKVWALKIKHICLADNNEGAELTPEEDAYAPFFVSQEYMDKHKPEVGGYYVVYEDGYKSFSPAGAFESGYTPL